MKRKVSFVTNSSSSSYILVGKKLHAYEVENEFCKRSTKMNIYGLSYYGSSEGVDVFKLTKKMFKYIAERKVKGSIEFYDVKALVDSETGAKISDLKPFVDEEDIKLFGIDKDYHSTDSLEDFIRKYVRDFEDD